MLFKKYGPFGGIIIKTREEFIRNISQMVERDIINHHTLESELKKDEVKAVINRTVEDFFSKIFFKNIDEDFFFFDIPGMERTFHNLNDFYKNNNDYFIQELGYPLIRNIDINEVLSREQTEYLFKEFSPVLIENIKKGDFVTAVVNNSYALYIDEPLSEFFLCSVFNKLKENIFKHLKGFHLKLEKEFDEELESTINSISSELELHKLTVEVVENLSSRAVTYFSDKKNQEKMKAFIKKEIIIFSQTDSGKKYLKNLISDFIVFLEKIDEPLYSFFNEGSEIKISGLPDIIGLFSNWIKTNQKEIEALLDESIDRVLEQGSGFKNEIKKLIRNAFTKDLIKEHNLFQKLINFIEEEKNSKEAKEILFKFIKEHSIGEVVNILKNTSVLNTDMISNMIIDHIEGIMDIILSEIDINSIIKIIDEINPEDYITEDEIKQFTAKIKENFIYSEKVDKGLINIFDKELNKYYTGKRKVEITKTHRKQAVEMINNYIVKKQDCIENNAVQAALGYLNKTTSKKRIMKSLLNYLPDYVYNNINKKDNLVNWIEKQCIENNKIEDFSNLVLDVVCANPSLILEGRVEKIISDNLNKLKDEEIEEVVREFMGRELKPITLFGGLLGGVSGVGLAYLQYYFQIIPPEWQLPSTVLTLGFVGFLTNALALKMVFRPYEEKNILGMTLPFTPGVVGRNKKRFAHSVSLFLGNELLNPEKVSKILKEKKELISRRIIESISSNEYYLIRRGFFNNTEIISENIYDYIFKQPESCHKIISKLFSDTGREAAVQKHITKVFLSDNISNKIAGDIKNVILDSDILMNVQIAKKIKKSTSILEIGTIINPDFSKITADYLSEKSIQKVLSLINDIDNNYFDFADYDTTLNNIFTDDLQEVLLYQANEMIISSLQRGVFLRDYNSKFKKLENKKLLQLFRMDLTKVLKKNTCFLLNTAGKWLTELMANERDKTQKIITKGIKKHLRQERKHKGLSNYLKISAAEVGYEILDVDETIKDIIDDLFERALPSYFQKKEKEILEIMAGIIDELPGVYIKKCSINLNYEQINTVITDSKFKQILLDILRMLTDIIGKYNLEDFIKFFEVDIKNDSKDLLQEEKIIIKRELQQKIEEKFPEIKEEIAVILDKILSHLLFSIRFNNLFQGINDKEIKNSINLILYKIFDSKEVDRQLNKMIEDIINSVSERGLKAFLDQDKFLEDMMRLLRKLNNNENFKKDFKKGIERVITLIFENINNTVDPKTLNFLLDKAVSSFMDSLDDNIVLFIKEIDIKNISEKEINNMSPEEIEYLFKSFADKYFTRLKHYGWLGGIIGLLIELLKSISI